MIHKYLLTTLLVIIGFFFQSHGHPHISENQEKNVLNPEPVPFLFHNGRQGPCTSVGMVFPYPTNNCKYVECVHGVGAQFGLIIRKCAPGTAVPKQFTQGTGNPCSVFTRTCKDGFPPVYPKPPTTPDRMPSTTGPTTTSTTTPTTTTATTDSMLPVIPDTGCPAPFLKFEDTHILGGDLIPAITSEEGCKRDCLGDRNCRAIDFDLITNQCFKFTLINQAMVMTLDKVNHYQKTSCSGPAGLPSDDFLYCIPGAHAFDGILQPGINSLDVCLLACAGSPTCEAIDFNFDGASCWFHNSSTSCGAITLKASCQHCKAVSCGDDDQRPLPPYGFDSEDVGFHLFGGVQQAGVFLQNTCLQLCVVDPDCRAVDYNKRDGSCWLHGEATACAPLEAKSDCSSFRKTACT